MPLNVLIGVALAALGTVLFFLWLPWSRHRSHRDQLPPKADPPTMELRDEPPAVVNLLVHELELTDDAFAATLLDLASRKHVEVIELSPDDNLVRVTPNPADPLLDYERSVLDVVTTAQGGGPHATIPAIAAALNPGSATAWFRFKAQVNRDAQARHLIGKAGAARGTNTIIVLSALPAIGFIVAIPQLWLVAPFVWGGLFLASVILVVIGRAYVLTPAGRTAAAHWLGVRDFIADHGNFDDLPPGAVAVWDRYLAYGAAMDLSDEASHGLIRELRTKLSVGDVRAAATEMRKLMNARSDPEANREWRAQVLAREFGANAPADDIWGPTADDFWTLLNSSARALQVAMMTASADPGLFRTASLARVAELERLAPPDLAGDVRTLATAAREAVAAVTAHRSPAIDEAAATAAAERLAAVAGPHLDAHSATWLQSALAARSTPPS